MKKTWRNWAGNVVVTPPNFFQPHSTAELIEQVQQCERKQQRLQVVGSGRSSSSLIHNPQAAYFSVSELNRILHCSQPDGTITAEAGISLRETDLYAHKQGMSLGNLGTIAVQSLAGATATATHGSSLKYNNLSSQIEDIQILTTKDCQLHWASELGNETLAAARVSLGALGIVTAIKLKLVKQRYLMLQQSTISHQQLLDNFENYIHDNDYAKFLYIPDVDRYVLWRANYSDQMPQQRWRRNFSQLLYGELIANSLHELLLWLARQKQQRQALVNRIMYRCLYQRPSTHCDLSYHIFNIAIRIRQRVMELAVDFEDTAAAITEMRNHCQKTTMAIHQPVEIRFSKANNNWLSPAYKRDICSLNFVAYQPFRTPVDYQSVFQYFEQALAPFSPRPHWAKFFTHENYDWHQLYPRLADFSRLQQQLNPSGSLSNDFIKRILR